MGDRLWNGTDVTVGETLREARLRRGLTLADVADRVKLRETIVAAIESDDLSLCGGHAYARGHIRALAVVLDLDGEVLVSELP
jgi:cytoskeletal protein RodZ